MADIEKFVHLKVKSHYSILEGSMKIKDRVINMDDSFEIGGNWISMQNILDKYLKDDISEKMSNSVTFKYLIYEKNHRINTEENQYLDLYLDNFQSYIFYFKISIFLFLIS